MIRPDVIDRKYLIAIVFINCNTAYHIIEFWKKVETNNS